MAEILRIARKEFRGFFASPAAFLFLGAFLVVTLFVLFWVEAFFARNLADLRPLFEWLPLLLIFLVAALTMRSWSEERRGGTLELLLTAPLAPLKLVLGKFAAALALVALALLLTLPLPLTVAALGPLDWGPVIGGYVATLFLAAAYVAIGLYLSARTDNPVVALILTALVCGVFYLIGSPLLGGLVGHEAGAVLAQLGTGSRFSSITRGVLDLRDLYYYLSLVGVFLALNLYSLERLRWAADAGGGHHRRWGWLTGLAIANLVVANLWLAPIGSVRADITEDKLYSLSETTEVYLARLQEPLLIRGYFSDRTHPLLAPLVPRIKDLLSEYAVAAGGRARVEFIDPHRDRDAEEEAASRYGVRPVPFQVASRHQAGVVSSYFDIVVAYGDQHEVLSFQDLIEARVSRGGDGELEVALKNPEYAVTGAIRKVTEAYRAGGNPFETLTQPVVFRGYLSPDERLPAPLRELRGELTELLETLQSQAGGRLSVEFADPEAGEGELARELERDYGFGPQVASLLDPEPFWFYLLLESEGQSVQVPLPESLDRDGMERTLTAALQRLAPGFLKTVALVVPPAETGKQYGLLAEYLGEGVRVRQTDLADGRVPAEADLLMVLSPGALDDSQRFAIDQFLMRGGSVVMATSPFDVHAAGSLSASRHDSGLTDWLAHHGIEIAEEMVLDPRNAALPVPVRRYVGNIPVHEVRMLPYPHFPDLRDDGLSRESPITAGLGQLTLNWASPLSVDAEVNADRRVSELLRSSPESWTSDSLELVPDYGVHPDTGFPLPAERGSQLLAVAVEGRFDSFYGGKDAPLAARGEGDEAGAAPIAGVIDRSPETARLVVIASNTFASDAAISLASQALGSVYLRPIEFLQNAIDWSLEDRGLLALRGRAEFARTLAPLSEGGRVFWESLNYALVLGGLLLVWGWRRLVGRADRARYRQILAEV